ncbi:hypothetical protein AVEN_124665-1 [Araneus ventricosus]|uniref:Uncharacterized protein n=1 Tax=Araneus ventricosus TaxID=182803 RepID=A0A4Y2WZI8_ARAVE|nr:hypothetical protein AVEN_53999-1 [Araneus ventricosus]GBO42689.1 hypothetical protein AVEN_140566-1 [Araneus ventricosus]GBO42699.1 hypothetical protein AVEN_50776-1 [Araneus ventricosus]GBO42701.1 hypothetical protein AVEN_124665-1 [Araneus ventricosus]
MVTSDVSFTPERNRGSGSSKETTRSDAAKKERIREIGIGFTDSDSESLIQIHNLRRGFVLFWNERFIIWGHGFRQVSWEQKRMLRFG